MADHQSAFPLRPILWLIGGGFLIGLSSCLGFLSSFGSAASGPFAIGFFGGVVAVLLGILIAIVMGLVSLVGSIAKPRT